MYVGHTTNFVQRKQTHKQSCNNNYNCKLYNVIRNNGGWDNWEMIMLEFFNCKNCTEARTKEQEYYEKLHATLNSVEPLPIKKEVNIEMFACKRCGYSTNIKCDLKKHLYRKTQCNPELSELDVLILHPEFFNKKKDKEYICEYCFKSFSFSSGKSLHKKTCAEKMLQNEKIEELEKQNKQLTKQLKESDKRLKESDKRLKESEIRLKESDKRLKESEIRKLV